MEIIVNPSLKVLNTFGVTAHARELIYIDHLKDIREIVKRIKKSDMPYLIMGSGSNILFTKDYEGIIIINRLKGKSIVQEDNRYGWASAMSGENWHEFVRYTISKNLQGLENLSLIPGTLGAAPVQNIGAYGVELKDIFEYLKAYDLLTGENLLFNASSCQFEYRNSIFKKQHNNRYLITEVCLRLNKKPSFNLSYESLQHLYEKYASKLTPEIISDEIISIRQTKLPDPFKLANAGSFFKNPFISNKVFQNIREKYPEVPGHPINDSIWKIPAGWLIERSGWKGKRIGDAGVYPRQALVLVNYGKATGTDILHLARRIQHDVYRQFNIHLDTEVLVI